MHKILDRLMISDLSEASDPFYLERHGIQAILYFGASGFFPAGIKLYHHATLKDGTLSPEMLTDGIDFLRESLRAGRRVLAVGSTGATIVAAYLAEMGMSITQALEIIGTSAARPDTASVTAHDQELKRRALATFQHEQV